MYKIKSITHSFLGFISLALVSIGFISLYSATYGGSQTRLQKQSIFYLVGLVIFFIFSNIKIKTLKIYSYQIYFISLFLLILVEITGFIGMGAQRWLNLYIFNLQPSELMKIALVLFLARFFHDFHEFKSKFHLLFAVIAVLIPTVLILKQPDLGTACIILSQSAAIFFAAGVSIRFFIAIASLCAAAIPIIWFFFLHQYQKQRIFTFFNPEADPLGAGYHIIQSKIAIGSAGIWGKGFLNGTQSHLNFLPEKQTDFIFSVICEEFGFLGAFLLWATFLSIINHTLITSSYTKDTFSRLISVGFASIIFVYVFTNTAMTIGALPVVGIPIPVISYGGTSVVSFFLMLGIINSVEQKCK